MPLRLSRSALRSDLAQVAGLHLGHTVAAVSTVLTAFMGGLAAGAMLAGRRAELLTPAKALRACAVFEALIAATAVIVPFAIAAAEPLLAATYADGRGAWFGLDARCDRTGRARGADARHGGDLPFRDTWAR